jgi:alpha-L-fucosidase 2
MQEMLLQSQNGYLDFLPTLPNEWATGSVKGFVARGNFEVDMDWSDGKANDFKVVSRNGNAFKGQYPGIANATVTEMRADGTNKKSVTPAKNGTGEISFPTTAGRVYMISFNTDSQKLQDTIAKAQALSKTMTDTWLTAPKGVFDAAISAAQAASAQTGENYTSAINTLNKAINTAKGAVKLCAAAREAKTFQSNLKIGTLPWEYTQSEVAAYGDAIATAVNPLIWAQASTSDSQYSAAETALAAETEAVKLRTDNLKVSFSWATNSVTMSSSYSVAEIRYTLDGSAPAQYSNIYKTPVAFNNGTTIKAALFYGGKRVSDVAEYIYRNTPDNVFRTATVSTHAAIGFTNPGNAYDGNAATSSNTPSGSGQNTADSSARLTITFSAPVTVSSTRLFRSSASYWINKFSIQYSKNNGATWTTAYSYGGPDTIPLDYFATFPEFTANMVRLNVIEGWASRIYEWELYDGIKPLNADKTSLSAKKAQYDSAVDLGLYPNPANPPADLSDKDGTFIDILSYMKAVLENDYADTATVADAYGVADGAADELGVVPKFDVSALTAAVAQANALNTVNYDSDAKVSAFEDALAKAEAVLAADASTLQAAVDKALSELDSAMAAMMATAKNWSYLNGLVAAATNVEQGINNGDYLDVNTSDFFDALDDARLLQSKPETKQHAINKAAEKLIKTIGKLVTSDKSDLLKDVNDAAGLYDRGIAALLAAGGLKRFEDAYEAAIAALYNPAATSSQVTKARTDLKAVRDDLGLIPADKAALDRSADDGSKLKASDYTDADLFAAFKTALDQVKALLADSGTLQVEAEKALSALQSARVALNAKVKNSGSLTSAIADYNKELPSLKAKYVLSDVLMFESMLEKANQIAASATSTQDDYDSAVASLKDLRAMLRIGADKTALIASLAKANKIVKRYYTKGTVSAFTLALNNAKAINNNFNLSASEQPIVNAADKQLNSTMGKLVYNVTKMKLAKKPKALKKGKTFKLNVKVTPTGIQKAVKLTYKSSNKKVATVSAAGKITAKKKGKATITVTAPNGKTLKVQITVK